MFRANRRRNCLIKRVSRCVIRDEIKDNSAQESCAEFEDSVDQVRLVLERLTDDQLETFARVVDTRGASERTSCIEVSTGNPSRSDNNELFLRICRLWRFKDLQFGYELKRTPDCQLGRSETPGVECCNPYHWAKLVILDELPPAYSLSRLKRDESSDSSTDAVSTETGGTNQYNSCFHSQQRSVDKGSPTTRHWCNLAYWEQKTRVGNLFPVHKPTIDIFGDLSHGNGLDLTTLGSTAHPNCDVNTEKTRSKIGNGVIISYEAAPGCNPTVWLYNRSDVPVFVASPTLSPPQLGKSKVFKIPSGGAMEVFNYEVNCDLYRKSKTRVVGRTVDGPFDPSSVRVSFAKGWGSGYSRLDISSCPCWLEVLVVPPDS